MSERKDAEMDDDGETGRIVAIEDIKEGEECLMGSAVAYRVDPREMECGEIDAYSCDFAVDFDLLSCPEQLRERGGGRVSPIRYGELRRSLSDEIVVLFGPNVSPALAIEMLRYVEERIERKGLLVRKNGEWESERVRKR